MKEGPSSRRKRFAAMRGPLALLVLLILTNPVAAASTSTYVRPEPLYLAGLPVDFILFGLTLLGVALFHHRPHRALDRRTPAEAFTARPPATPGDGIGRPHYRLRRDVIDKAGSVTLRHDSRLHHIGLGRLRAGTQVILLVADLNVRVITEDGELLRELTLDPTRDYQPRGVKPGPQPRPRCDDVPRQV